MNVRPLFEKDATTAAPGGDGFGATPGIAWQPLKEKLARLDTEKSGLSPEESRRLQADSFLAGRKDAEGEVQSLRQRLAESLDRLDKVYQATAERAEQDLVELSLLIAREVLAQEAPLARTFAQKMVKHAMGLMTGADGAMTVRVSPSDHAWLTQHQASWATASGIALVADARLAGGGVIAETSRGRVDASFASRLRSIAEALGSGAVLAEAQAQETQS